MWVWEVYQRMVLHRYGRFLSLVSYYLCYDKDTISKIFTRLRKDRKVTLSQLCVMRRCVDSTIFVHSILLGVAARLKWCLWWIWPLGTTAPTLLTILQWVNNGLTCACYNTVLLIQALPVDPNCQLITFTLDTNAVFTLRTSGTEPKIKYYVEVSSKPGTE